MDANDHTLEVEQRIAAIRISSEDTCAFFKIREKALTNTKRCGNCAFGVFEYDEAKKSYGLCKYRIQNGR